MLLTLSCRTKKEVTNAQKLKSKSPEELIDCFQQNSLQCERLSLKSQATILFGEEKNTVKSNLRLRRDSAVWVSLSKSSLPVMTALISQDSVKVLKKIGNKEYFLGAIEEINLFLNTEVNYPLLEDFLLGKPIAFDDEAKYLASIDASYYLLSSEKSKRIEKILHEENSNGQALLYRCWINPDNCTCAKVVINLIQESTILQVNYGDWEEIEGQLYPMKSSLEIITPEDTIALSLSHTRIELNKEQRMPFRITDSYTRFELNTGDE